MANIVVVVVLLIRNSPPRLGRKRVRFLNDKLKLVGGGRETSWTHTYSCSTTTEHKMLESFQSLQYLTEHLTLEIHPFQTGTLQHSTAKESSHFVLVDI